MIWSQDDAAAFAGCVGCGTDAGFGGELIGGGKALAHVTQLGKDLGGADSAGAWKRHDDLSLRQFGDGLLDATGELGDFGRSSTATKA